MCRTARRRGPSASIPSWHAATVGRRHHRRDQGQRSPRGCLLRAHRWPTAGSSSTQPAPSAVGKGDMLSLTAFRPPGIQVVARVARVRTVAADGVVSTSPSNVEGLAGDGGRDRSAAAWRTRTTDPLFAAMEQVVDSARVDVDAGAQAPGGILPGWSVQRDLLERRGVVGPSRAQGLCCAHDTRGASSSRRTGRRRPLRRGHRASCRH